MSYYAYISCKLCTVRSGMSTTHTHLLTRKMQCIERKKHTLNVSYRNHRPAFNMGASTVITKRVGNHGNVVLTYYFTSVKWPFMLSLSYAIHPVEILLPYNKSIFI